MSGEVFGSVFGAIHCSSEIVFFFINTIELERSKAFDDRFGLFDLNIGCYPVKVYHDDGDVWYGEGKRLN